MYTYVVRINISIYVSGGIVDFATFLEVMYEHSLKERCQQEIQAGFLSQDRKGTGQVSAGVLWHNLTNFGEKLSKQEGIWCKFLFTSVLS